MARAEAHAVRSKDRVIGLTLALAVFTLVVQNSVNAARIGVATASLTFFQQIGGTIGLTLAGSLLATRLVSEIP